MSKKSPHFDPGALPPGRDRDQFKIWFRQVHVHHEFSEVLERLEKTYRGTTPSLADVEFLILWECWRSATWSPNPDISQTVKKYQKAKNEGNEIGMRLALEEFPIVFRYGPFLYGEDVINHKRRQPNAATLLAADLAIMLGWLKMKPDWVLFSKLIAVAGLNDALDRNSLRLAAKKLLDGVRQKKLLRIGWPQDTGEGMRPIGRYLDRAKAFMEQLRQ